MSIQKHDGVLYGSFSYAAVETPTLGRLRSPRAGVLRFETDRPDDGGPPTYWEVGRSDGEPWGDIPADVEAALRLGASIEMTSDRAYSLIRKLPTKLGAEIP